MTRGQRAPGRPHPAVAAIRSAVRACLTAEPHLSRPGRKRSASGGNVSGPKLKVPAQSPPLVLAAVSGGADSLALADALAFETPGLGIRAGAVIVDHGLQPGSAAVAERAADTCRSLGLHPVEVVPVTVVDDGTGLEAAARAARYAALTAAADRLGAVAVLLGHTRDDQAEQVLLGLTRGSGTRSLSGMPRSRGPFRRPLLGISRAETRAACAAEGVAFWDDPMNDDPAFTRVRARQALADLERDLGPGITAALARSADQLRADADHLDALAAATRAGLPASGPVPVDDLEAIPGPVRSRVWRLLLTEAGAPAGQTGSTHTAACDRLLTHWRGQGPIDVPGAVRVSRRAGSVHITGSSQVE